MRIACCGDQHITSRKPANRTDDYFATVLNKFKQELQIAHEGQCDLIALPGDVFDTYKENHLVVQSIVDIIKKQSIPIMLVAGQHDQQFHNPDLKGTALGTLLQHPNIYLLNGFNSGFMGLDFYGASWNEEIPTIVNPKKLNVLVLHKMIVDEKLWAAQEGHTWGSGLMKTSGFDLIVSGDNHQQFVLTSGNKVLVNMGSMMRSTVSQVNHEPAVAIWDSAEPRNVNIIKLNIKPFSEVFVRLEDAIKRKEHNEQMEAFVSSLKDGGDEDAHKVKLNFVEALENYIEVNKVDESVAAIIYEVLS